VNTSVNWTKLYAHLGGTPDMSDAENALHNFVKQREDLLSSLQDLDKKWDKMDNTYFPGSQESLSDLSAKMNQVRNKIVLINEILGKPLNDFTPVK